MENRYYIGKNEKYGIPTNILTPPFSRKFYHKVETAARRSAGNELPALMMTAQKDVKI